MQIDQAVNILLELEGLALRYNAEWIGCEWRDEFLWIFVSEENIYTWLNLPFTTVPCTGQFAIASGGDKNKGVGKIVDKFTATTHNKWFWCDF